MSLYISKITAFQIPSLSIVVGLMLVSSVAYLSNLLVLKDLD